MVWDKVKRWLGLKKEGAPQTPEREGADVSAPESETPSESICWVEAEESPWRVPVLDVRPLTLTSLSFSAQVEHAQNAISYGQEDGVCFLGEAPPSPRVVEASLRFPVDRTLADGVLFVPNTMEHKWAIFAHRAQILVVRSWLRKVHVVADVAARPGEIEVTRIRGHVVDEHETPDFTIRALDFLLRSHALGEVYPAPLGPGLETDLATAARWCFSVFGNQVSFATPHVFERALPDRPLRTHSLLHIAVARGDAAAVHQQLAAGVLVDLLAGDGQAPLHWALESASPEMVALLLDKGSPVDVRSTVGSTPLMLAVQLKKRDALRLLIDRGADVNARDARGFTGLHRAAERGDLETCELLLDHGAAPDPEASGHTPRSLAQGRDHAAVVALLDRRAAAGRS